MADKLSVQDLKAKNEDLCTRVAALEHGVAAVIRMLDVVMVAMARYAQPKEEKPDKQENGNENSEVGG